MFRTILVLAGLFVLITWALLKNKRRDALSYKMYMISMPQCKDRQAMFYENHNPNVPVEQVYGPDTTTPTGAREFENDVDPMYFKKSLEMYYRPELIRPNVTFFQLGAIGAQKAHVSTWRRARDAGAKYALVVEDNVKILNDDFYREVEEAIRESNDNFEMIFFHCHNRLKGSERLGRLEKVLWISGMKAYVIHVHNMQKFEKMLYPQDNHIDNKLEDLIARGARIFYKDLRHCMALDRSFPSTIQHRDHGERQFFSRQNPDMDRDSLEDGY